MKKLALGIVVALLTSVSLAGTILVKGFLPLPSHTNLADTVRDLTNTIADRATFYQIKAQ
jgi:hypothetical protein